jgi:hypothetical protein
MRELGLVILLGATACASQPGRDGPATGPLGSITELDMTNLDHPITVLKVRRWSDPKR